MIEQQVQVVVLAVDGHAFLPRDEREPHAQFQDEGLHLPQDRRL